MDQSAFRNLLSTGASSSSPSSSHPKSKSRGVLGGPAPKRGTAGVAGGGAWGIKVKPGNEYKPPPSDSKPSTSFTPRNQYKKKDDGKYMDRAERRRLGLDDEYKPVEQLLENLERRQKDEGVDEKEIDRQRAYLGGDATHSILVKGLDYALLARTRAELAVKGEEVADEELEDLVRGAQVKKRPVKEEKKPEEKMAKGFKSITAKADDVSSTGEKRKKKKKKVKPVEPSTAEVKTEPIAGPSRPKSPIPPAKSSKREEKAAAPPPVDDDDDIFGDAGNYDLTAGRVDEDESDEEGQAMDDEDDASPRRRGRSRSTEDSKSPPPRDRSKSYERSYVREDSRRDRSRSRNRRRDRSYSRDRYDDWRRERSYSRERYSDRRRERSHSRENYRRGERSHSPNGYGRRERSYSRDRYDRRDRSHSRERNISKRDRQSPSPHRRAPSRSPSPTSKRPRRVTRSPSPIRFDYDPRAISPSPSDDSEDDHLVGGKLQPLKSSALADVKGYLSLEAKAAEDEEKKARKAKWRAKQGLGLQEGAEKYLEREVGEGEKANRDYVKLMNKLKKDDKGKEEGK